MLGLYQVGEAGRLEPGSELLDAVDRASEPVQHAGKLPDRSALKQTVDALFA